MIRSLFRFGCAVVGAAAYLVADALAGDRSRAIVAGLTRSDPEFVDHMDQLDRLFADEQP